LIEHTILSNLLYNEDYVRKTVPYVKDEYFSEVEHKIVFNILYDYFTKYNKLSTKESLRISIDDKDGLSEEVYNNLNSIVDDLSIDKETDIDWLLDVTEKFCQEKAIYNAVKHSIVILDGKDKNLSRGAIPELLSDALSISFDTNIGHDFIENVDDRFDFYHNVEEKLSFDLEYFNKITKNGLSKKSLSICMAGTGAGKTMFMTHCASSNLMSGKNVLYITLEMAEEKIAERIDANLLDTTIDDLSLLTREAYHKKVDRVKRNTTGKLIIKEYPTASANSNHFRFLLNELKMKKNFKPDVIYIDYLNICGSSRMKMGASVNSYTYIKAIAEEIRGLAVEFDIPIMSATQVNREGFTNSDPDLTNTSESFGLPATADFMFALITNEEMEQTNQLMVKQLKNRWGDVNNPTRFIVGTNRAKMKLFDVNASVQKTVSNESSKKLLIDDTPVMDNTKTGARLKAEKRSFGEFQ
jgi:replicative DNA helicase